MASSIVALEQPPTCSLEVLFLWLKYSSRFLIWKLSPSSLPHFQVRHRTKPGLGNHQSASHDRPHHTSSSSDFPFSETWPSDLQLCFIKMARDDRVLQRPRLLAWLMPCLQGERGYQLIAPGSNLLSVLPAELILAIADYMPPNDIIYFSLCDHRLFSLLHKRTATRLGTSATLELLRQLERDLPNHFTCHCCITLHRCHMAGRLENDTLFNTVSNLRCFANRSWTRAELLMNTHYNDHSLNYDFSFIHLQLAMKRFCCGIQHGPTPERLSHLEVQERCAPRCTTLFSIEAKVCTAPLGLYLRIQDIILIKDRVEELFAYPKRIYRGDPPNHLIICSHLPFVEIKELMDPLLPTYKQSQSPIRREGTCEKCNTDFLLELQEFDGHLAFVVTRWMNLGPGLAPEDPLWRVRSCEAAFHPIELESDTMAWSPRRSYESASGDWLQETWLSRNLSWLKGERYRSYLHHERASTWLLKSPESPHAQADNRKVRR